MSLAGHAFLALWNDTTEAVLMIAMRASDLILGQESVPQAETAEALP
jgi:hypothetical protein